MDLESGGLDALVRRGWDEGCICRGRLNTAQLSIAVDATIRSSRRGSRIADLPVAFPRPNDVRDTFH